MQTTTATIHKAITDRIIKAIENDQLSPPWRKPWRPDLENSGFPCNLLGKPFTGINALLLNLAASAKGLNSKFWHPQSAWETIGGRRFGEGTLIFRNVDQCSLVTVHNADEVSGGEADRFQSHRRSVPLAPDYGPADRLIAASGATIHHRCGMEAAYYFPPADYIVFPLKSQFLSGPGGLPGYYDSLFHELAHMTEPRLQWECSDDCVRELRSEIAAPLLASQLGIPVLCEMHKIANHVKHQARWIEAMKNDPHLIFNVAEDASAAVVYLFSATKAATT